MPTSFHCDKLSEHSKLPNICHNSSIVLCNNNQLTISLSNNLTFHERSKHIELHYRILKQKKLEINEIILVYWSIADILEDVVPKDVPKSKTFVLL